MLRIFIYLSGLLLLNACQNVDSKNSNNQFQNINGKLNFDNKALSSWLEATTPSCELCRLKDYQKVSPAGPILFQKINNKHGKLIFFSVKNARVSFALSTGSRQHSIRLKMIDEKLSIAVDQTSFFRLNKNDVVNLKIGSQYYFIKLTTLTFNNLNVKGRASEKTSYMADIIIWLDPEH
jgi:hypothetical protein